MMFRRPYLAVLLITLVHSFTVSALEQEPGLRLIFRYSTGGALRSRPAAGRDGTTYILSEDRYLYAVDPDGLTVFRSFLGERVGDCLSVGRDGTVYCGSKDGKLFAVNPRGGIIWSFAMESQPAGDPITLPDGTVIVAASSGTLYGLSHTGRLLWQRSLQTQITESPVSGEYGDLFVPCADSRVYRLSLAGEVIWDFLCAGIPGRPALGADGSVYLSTSSGTIVSILPQGVMGFSYTADTGFSSPVIGEHCIYATSSDGYLLCISMEGKLLWKLKLPVDAQSGCTLGKGKIYVQGNRGELFTISEGGELLSAQPSAAKGTSPLLTYDGRLCVGGSDWVLYVFGGAVQPCGFWPQPGCDMFHSGTASFPHCKRQVRGGIELLNQLAALDDEAVRLSVISDIEAALKSGYSLETPRLLSIVDFLATDAVIRTEMDGKKVMHDFPRVREKAVGLLAQYGNLESIPLLLSALGAEHDPLVRRALIKALAAQKSDPEGHAMKLLCTLARAEARSDTLLALDILSAIENISQYQGALSKEGFDACFMLSKSDVKEVSEKARSVLLKRYR